MEFRAKQIGLTRPPVNLALATYCCRVVPLVGYVGQFVDAGVDLVRKEQTGLHHAMGLATNAADMRHLLAYGNVTKLRMRSAP